MLKKLVAGLNTGKLEQNIPSVKDQIVNLGVPIYAGQKVFVILTKEGLQNAGINISQNKFNNLGVLYEEGVQSSIETIELISDKLGIPADKIGPAMIDEVNALCSDMNNIEALNKLGIHYLYAFSGKSGLPITLRDLLPVKEDAWLGKIFDYNGRFTNNPGWYEGGFFDFPASNEGFFVTLR